MESDDEKTGCRRYHQVDLGKSLGKTEVEVRRLIRDGVIPAPTHRLEGGKRPYYTEAEVREIARSCRKMKRDGASLLADDLEDALVLIRQVSIEMDARWGDRFGRIANRLAGLIEDYDEAGRIEDDTARSMSRPDPIPGGPADHPQVTGRAVVGHSNPPGHRTGGPGQADR